MHDATAIRREGDRLHVALSDGGEVSARAVILATGATYRRLGVPELEALVGAGVFYGGPASEAPTTVDEEVYVVGGANSAGQAALHLAEYARRVTLVVRAESLDKGMSHYLVRQVEGTPNIEVRLGTEVVGGGGGEDGWLERLVLRSRADGATETVAADELFLMIGARPNTDWLPAELARGDGGFIRTGADVEERRELAARAQPALPRDQHARRLRRGRRPPRVDEPRRLRGRRGLDRDQARPRALRGRAAAIRATGSDLDYPARGVPQVGRRRPRTARRIRSARRLSRGLERRARFPLRSCWRGSRCRSG